MTHSSSSRPRQLLLVTTLLGTLAAPPLWAAVSTFNVNVPRKSGGSLKQISQIVVTAQVDSTAPIDFTITPPAGHGSATATGPMQPAVAPPHVSLFFGVVQVYPPDTTGLAANDPRRRNYKFVISPTFDFDANCLSTPMLGDETWQVAVTGGSSRVTDACSVSFDENVLGNECNGALRPVPLNEAVAELGGLSSQEQTCRFGVDAMLVLDRSGSMSSRSNVNQPVSATNTRIVSLRNAVQSFVSTLNSVRAAESTTFATVSNDQVGAVIFNQDAADLPGLASGLNTFNATTASALTGGINGTNPSGSTSIGDGLLSAAGALGGAAPDRRRVILLMSDGLQNTDQRVGANVATHSVFTHPSGMASGPNLPNLSNFQIYTVTVGNGMAVNAQVNQDIALATGGFYLNSEDDAGQLPTFFGGLLQNFLETTTWQTVLAGADKASLAAPFTATVPITTTTQAVVVTVTPKDRRSRLCLVVTPPTGTALQPTCGSGVLTSAFTAASVQALGGAWQIRVQPQVGDNAPGDHFFNLLVIADDLGTGARVTTSSATYAPGDPIRVEAKLSELGTAIVGLDPNQLRVSLASPTRTLGEIMAASTAPTTQPAGDTADDATAKLQNEIETNPAVLDQTHSSVSLRDDGTGGDRTAGDGVYSAEFTVRNYGHVGLDVTLQGASPHGGGLRRQRLETLFLKAIPSGGATGVSSQVITDGDTRRLVMTITPRNRYRAPIRPSSPRTTSTAPTPPRWPSDPVRCRTSPSTSFRTRCSLVTACRRRACLGRSTARRSWCPTPRRPRSGQAGHCRCTGASMPLAGRSPTLATAERASGSTWSTASRRPWPPSCSMGMTASTARATAARSTTCRSTAKSISFRDRRGGRLRVPERAATTFPRGRARRASTSSPASRATRWRAWRSRARSASTSWTRPVWSRIS